MNTQHVIYIIWSSTNVDLKSIKPLYEAYSAVGGWVTGGGVAC